MALNTYSAKQVNEKASALMSQKPVYLSRTREDLQLSSQLKAHGRVFLGNM